jgi:hypothetical protein
MSDRAGTRNVLWSVRIAEPWTEPTRDIDLLPGDEVLIDREPAEVGECVAVSLPTDDVVIRRVVLEGGELLLRAPDGTTARRGNVGRVMGVVRFVPMSRRSGVVS